MILVIYSDSISTSLSEQNLYLLKFKEPKGKKYLVLESDIECLSKAIHVLIISDKSEFSIGRRVNNDVTVSDISVSRKQALVKIKGSKIFVSDCDSKFGTFVKVNGPLRMPENQTVPIQIEKKMFLFKLQNRFSCMQKCFRVNLGLKLENEDYDHYEKVKS